MKHQRISEELRVAFVAVVSFLVIRANLVSSMQRRAHACLPIAYLCRISMPYNEGPDKGRGRGVDAVGLA